MTAGATLDRTFQALANPTRRAVIERLTRGPATVSELAEPFDMALPSLLQHIEVLEHSGLVRSHKRGRVRTVHIRPAKLKKAAGWLEQQRDLWARRLDRLDAYVQEMDSQGS